MRNVQGNVQFAGAPSSGKSTAFDAIQTSMVKYPEMARMILEGGTFGKTIKEVTDKGNYPTFQERVVLLHRHNERISVDEGSLHDAGTVSAYAYVQDLPEPQKQNLTNLLVAHLLKCPPKKVFVFEPLPYKQDGVRHENPKYQKVIHDRIIKLCEDADFNWELVPAMGLELRLKFIKNGLKK
jgi:predicted ATPase